MIRKVRLFVIAVMISALATVGFFTAPEVRADGPKVTVTADADGRYYDIGLTDADLSGDLRAAVWNKADAGSMQWFKLSEGKTTFDILEYNAVGDYSVHVYRYQSEHSKTFVAGRDFSVSALPSYSHSLTGAFTDSTQSVYRLTLSDAYKTDKEDISAAVWSKEGGQDDIKWVTFYQTGAKEFSADINIAEFKHPGDFYAHVYRRSPSSNSFIGGHSFKVAPLTSGPIYLLNVSNDGTAAMAVTSVDSPAGISKVQVAVWSDAAQKDLVWYDAENDGYGNWIVYVDNANHAYNWAKYKAHAYATDGHGFRKFAAATELDFSLPSPTVTITPDGSAGTVTFTVSDFNVEKGVKELKAAAWTTAGGQDDLTWISLKKSGDTYTASVPVSTFKHKGAATAHIYMYKTNGTSQFVAGKGFEIKAPKATGAEMTTDNPSGKFSVKLHGLTSDSPVSKVRVAVWCKDDQSDLKWYNMSKVSEGEYALNNANISSHKYSVGKYKAHIYVETADGFDTFTSAASGTFTAKHGALTFKDIYSGVNDKEETLYEIKLANVEIPAGAKEVRFAVWPASNNHIIKWYTASQSGSTYSVNVPINDFQTMGTYNSHVYYINKNGDKVYLAGSKVMEIKGKPTGSISVTGENQAAGTFDVAVTGADAPAGVTSMRLAAWAASDQSDLAWYTMTKQSDGNFKVSVDVANHKHNLGKYNLHAYAVMGNGVQHFACGTNYTFNPSNFMYTTKTGRGLRQFVIKNSPHGQIAIAVWSDAHGQDDIKWINATKSGTTFTANIDLRDYNDYGTFQIHVYAGNTCLKVLHENFTREERYKNGWYYEDGYKFYYIDDVKQTDVSGILGPQGEYLAMVNRICCTVTIYARDGANGFIIPVKAFACSVGLPETPTYAGTFVTTAKQRWRELMGPSYGQYCTRIGPAANGIWFHSVAGWRMSSYNLAPIDYNNLGNPASHGCVRLNVASAKWIYDNCPLGMTVIVYDSAYPGPLGKPATIKIPDWQDWDPTDPNI